jgi:hypothetical protein
MPASSGRIDTRAKSSPRPLFRTVRTLPTLTSTGFSVPGPSVRSVTGSPTPLTQCPAVPMANEPPFRKMKFIVQPAGEIIHAPGRIPTIPGSGASAGAATG